MSAAFSGYMHNIWYKIQCKNFLGWSSFIRAANSAKWVRVHSVCCRCSSSNIYAGMALPLFYILYLSGHFLLFNGAVCTILLLWNPVFLWMPDCYFHTNLVYWQVLVVFYFVELLQRDYLAKRQLREETVSLWQCVISSTVSRNLWTWYCSDSCRSELFGHYVLEKTQRHFK